MKRAFRFIWALIAFSGMTAWAQESVLNRPVFPTPDAVRTTFAEGPGKDFATAPLWVWNDDLTEAQIRETLGDLASQGVLQAIVHPRPGLMTPYLSDDWFRLWRVALDEAKKLGMNLWIYDENSYPSGFAGGLVPEAMPESRGRGLVFREVESLPSIANDVLFVWKKTDDGFVNVTDAMKAEGMLPPGAWLLGLEQLAPLSEWYGGKFYVDLLKTGVTEKFLEITHEAYRRELGEAFGKGIYGIFTDEPRLQPGNARHWTEDLPAEFAKRYGFSLLDVAPLLQYEIEQKLPDGSAVSWQTVRHHYFQTLTEMMIDRWCRPNFAFCEKNGLEWTGHYWEHEWPIAGNSPDTMAFSFWHQRPAIDMLMNEWTEDVHAQFGNNRAVRELRSAANQSGRARTLSETYGAGGWDLRFCDMKRIADWQYALGINTVDEHLSYISIRGARKHDHPQSFSRAASWWPMYHAMEAYQTRLSYLMAQGEQRNRTWVLQPTTTMWMYEGSPKQAELGQAFANLCRELDARQAEYDLGSEEILRRVGSVEETGVLTVGHAHYTRVVLPAQMENLNAETVTLLNKFLDAGGSVWGLFTSAGQPKFVNGIEIARLSPAMNAAYQRLFEDRGEESRLWVEEKYPINDGENPDEIKLATARTSYGGYAEHDAVSALECLSDNLFFSDLSTKEEIKDFVKEKLSDLLGTLAPGFVIDALEPHCERTPSLFFHRRFIENGEILFFCNSDAERSIHGNFWLSPTIHNGKPVHFQRLEQLNPLTGTIQPEFPFENTGGDEEPQLIYDPRIQSDVVKTELCQLLMTRLLASYTLPIDLPPGGSAAFLATYVAETNADESNVSAEKESGDVPSRNIAASDSPKSEPLAPITPMTARRLASNALVIDYAELSVDGETSSDYFQRLNDTLWKKRGFEQGNPWSMAVQFRDELIRHEFADDSGFAVTYRFTLDPKFLETRLRESPLAAVVESANRYDAVTLNGKALDTSTEERFLDRDFVRLDLSDAIVAGENRLTLSVGKMTMRHEIMPVLLLGEFVLKAAEAGFVIEPSRDLDPLQPWSEQGLPFYSNGVEYAQTYSVEKRDGVRYVVSLGRLGALEKGKNTAWNGAAARVLVNGAEAGIVFCEPCELDVTALMVSGENRVAVETVGTPKNLFGPHHAGKMRGRAWPAAFAQAPPSLPPGDQYDVIPYGRTIPFLLETR